MKKPPFYKSLSFTIKGLIWILRNERNFQIQIFALIFNLLLIVALGLKPLDTLVIIGVCFLVLIAETFNTCIEKICDYIQPNHDKQIGIIKDVAGGAVLLSTILAICAGAIIYLPYIKEMIF